MFQKGASGEVTSGMASTVFATKIYKTPQADISTPAWGDAALANATFYGLPAVANAIGILWARVVYQAAAAGVAGTGRLDIGTIIPATGVTDVDAIVAAYLVSVTAVAGAVEQCTLVNTLRRTTPQSGGFPVVAVGRTVSFTLTVDAANTGDFIVEVGYFDIEPGE